MNINLFESKQYILQTASAFSTISENERPTARRRLINDDQGSSRAETTKTDVGHFAQITSKVLEILKIYPHLNASDQMGTQLKEIRDRIVKISPTFITDEFKLFSKLIDTPVITVSASDYAFNVNSALLVFRSEKTKTGWRFEGIDDPSKLHLTDFSAEEILRAVHFLETGETQQLTLENSLRFLSLGDFLVIPKLLEATQRMLQQHFSSLKTMTEGDMEKIVAWLNQELINQYPQLKSTLENCISQFFNQLFQSGPSNDYLAIKRQIKKLIQPITLNLESPTDLQLTQIKKLPLCSIKILNCQNLTPQCWQMLSEIKELRSVQFFKALWVDDQFLAKLFQNQGIKNLSLSHCPQITDAGVAHLPNDLHQLLLSHCAGVTDESAEKFKKMTQLRALSLIKTSVGNLTIEALNNEIETLSTTYNHKITDRSAEKLKQMTKLRKLHLNNTSISDSMINALSNDIQHLGLHGCKGVTDHSAEKFKKMTQLTQITLDFTTVSDITLQALSDNLEMLGLLGCRNITDTSIPIIVNMKRLKSLRIGGTQVSNQGLENLRQKRPTLNIIEK
jgi:hypothetical protein